MMGSVFLNSNLPDIINSIGLIFKLKTKEKPKAFELDVDCLNSMKAYSLDIKGEIFKPIPVHLVYI